VTPPLKPRQSKDPIHFFHEIPFGKGALHWASWKKPLPTDLIFLNRLKQIVLN